jgi:hypothetical protein
MSNINFQLMYSNKSFLMRLIINHLLSVFILSIIIGMSSCKENITSSSKNKAVLFTNSNLKNEFNQDDYSIRYPADWSLEESGAMGTKFLILSKQENENDKFQENVNLLIQSLEGLDMDLEGFTDLSVNQIKTLLTSPEIIFNETKTNIHDIKYQHIVYRSDQGVYKLVFNQYYIIKDKKAYVLTLTCEQDVYNDYVETGVDIMNSFSFKTN